MHKVNDPEYVQDMEDIITWIVVFAYLINSFLFVMFYLGYLTFIVGAYIFLKCVGSDFETPDED